ncbi:hypothetical protein MAHJHV35_47890 [Mycobacterium avium subsp. hominissuis]
MAADAIAQATHALLDADLLSAEGVITRQHSIAALVLQAEETAFALLALQAPVATDLRAVVSALRIAADAQRMVELAVHVAEIARRHGAVGVAPCRRRCGRSSRPWVRRPAPRPPHPWPR